MKSHILVVAVLTWLLPISAIAAINSEVLFDNGAPIGGLGQWISIKPGDATRPRVADDFVLTGPAEITGVTFWTVEEGTWGGSLEYFIYADIGGVPALIPIASGNAVNHSREVTGSFRIGTQYENTFEFETPLYVPESTVLWLGLYMNEVPASGSIFWETTADGFGSQIVVAEADDPIGNLWRPIPGEPHAAFQINGVLVPEPSSLVLFGIGAASVIAFGAFRRPKNR